MEKEHMEIILEDINGKFDLVLEGHDVLRHEIHEVRQDAQEKFEFLSSLIQEVNKKVDKVDKRLSGKIDSADKSLIAKIDAVDKRLSGKIDAVDKRLSDKIDVLDKRINTVDKRLGDKIEAVAVDLAAHRADTETHGKRYRVSEE